MSRDLETRLDDALARLASGNSPDAALADASDVADLIVVARELQILAPTPQPRLAEGRRKFLNEAARLAQPARRFGRGIPRSAPAFVFAAMFVLMVFGALMVTKVIPVAGTETIPLSSSLTMSPTYLPTPLKTATASVNVVSSAPTFVVHLTELPQPRPVPTAASTRE
jgi:hypothetical protein